MHCCRFNYTYCHDCSNLDVRIVSYFSIQILTHFFICQASYLYFLFFYLLFCDRIFISKGIEVNKIANSGGTALMFAAGGGHNETTRLLLDFKADPNVIVQAKPEYILQVIQKIADKKEDAEPHKDGVTALHVAAQGGHIGTVKMLVDAGAVIRVADDEEMTPLLNAVKGNYGNVASYLVQQGADPNDVFVDEKAKKHNLLMDAVVVSNKEFALLLIEKGANISHADAEGVTVTTQAAYQGLLSIVEALIAKGADVTVMNNEGINPLIAAASEGHHEIVKALLTHGKGDVNAKDKDGTNALMAASVRGHKEVVSQLLEVKCEVNAQVNTSHLLRLKTFMSYHHHYHHYYHHQYLLSSSSSSSS